MLEAKPDFKSSPYTRYIECSIFTSRNSSTKYSILLQIYEIAMIFLTKLEKTVSKQNLKDG